MVVSYIKVNGKTYTLEALCERFVHIPTRKFVEILRQNNVVLPRLLRIILLRKYLTPCIQNPTTNSYFSSQLKQRLVHFQYFTEYQLEELLALLKEDIDYTLYVRDFWLDILGMKDVLELSDGILDLLDKQVDYNFSEYNILTFNILTSHIFGDKYGFIDGVSKEQARNILNTSATVTTLRNIAKKYNVEIPQKMSNEFFASLVVEKYKEDPQYVENNVNSLLSANIESLEYFAENRNYDISYSNELGCYVEFVLLKANVRMVNDIVYSGYILSKKNSGDAFINSLIENKSTESIVEGNHVQLYTTQDELFEDFEYNESLVARVKSETTEIVSDEMDTTDPANNISDDLLQNILTPKEIDKEGEIDESLRNMLSNDGISSDSENKIDDEVLNILMSGDSHDEIGNIHDTDNDMLSIMTTNESNDNTNDDDIIGDELFSIFTSAESDDFANINDTTDDKLLVLDETTDDDSDNSSYQSELDLFSSLATVVDLDDTPEETFEFDSLLTDTISMNSKKRDELTKKTAELDKDDQPEIINLSDEIKNIDFVLSGRKGENVIFTDVLEVNDSSQENDDEHEPDDEAEIEIEDLNLKDKSLTELDLNFDSSGANTSYTDNLEDITENSNFTDSGLTEFEEIFLDETTENYDDFDIEFELDGTKKDSELNIDEFLNLDDELNSSIDNIEFDGIIEDDQIFIDENNEEFRDLSVDAPEFDRIGTFNYESDEEFDIDQMLDNANDSNELDIKIEFVNDFDSLNDFDSTNHFENYDEFERSPEITGVSQDLVIGELNEVKFEYDLLDSSEAKQIDDIENISNLMFTTEVIEPITIEDDSYELDLDMDVDLSNEHSSISNEYNYNKAPELYVKVDKSSENTFDIDLEMPTDVTVQGNVGNEEEVIDKSVTLDAEFDRFLKEIDEIKTASVLEFDDDAGKYKFEINEEDIKKLKNAKGLDNTSLDEKEDELLAALTDLD